MSTFVDYAVAAGPKKISKVRDAQRIVRQRFDPSKDYWGPLRKDIVRLHEKGAHKSELDRVIQKVDPKKHANYLANIQGYKRFLGRQILPRIALPTRRRWTYGELSIRVTPDLGLSIKGNPYFFRLHFKTSDERLTRERRFALTYLMRAACGDDAVNGIVDVRAGELIVPKISSNVEDWIHGEAVSFIQSWHDLEGRGQAVGD